VHEPPREILSALREWFTLHTWVDS
jgi:hypothetical protein